MRWGEDWKVRTEIVEGYVEVRWKKQVVPWGKWNQHSCAQWCGDRLPSMAAWDAYVNSIHWWLKRNTVPTYTSCHIHPFCFSKASNAESWAIFSTLGQSNSGTHSFDWKFVSLKNNGPLCLLYCFPASHWGVLSSASHFCLNTWISSSFRAINSGRSRLIQVANETMCSLIQALTEARGYTTSSHMYLCNAVLSKVGTHWCFHRIAPFRGAGGQHACEIALCLGIKTILIYWHSSSILSTVGWSVSHLSVTVTHLLCTEHNNFNGQLWGPIKPTMTISLPDLTSLNHKYGRSWHDSIT